jgi:hypothetical protein
VTCLSVELSVDATTAGLVPASVSLLLSVELNVVNVLSGVLSTFSVTRLSDVISIDVIATVLAPISVTCRSVVLDIVSVTLLAVELTVDVPLDVLASLSVI